MESSKRCLCRKGFQKLNLEENRESYMCVPEQDCEDRIDHQIDAATPATGANSQNFKVQVLQGMLNIITGMYQLYILNWNINYPSCFKTFQDLVL